MSKSLYRQLADRIGEMPPGSVIAVSDFSDLAMPKTVSKMLARLCDDGRIERVMRSIFWVPSSEGAMPEADAVARALARENNWYLAPSGDTALRLFGLSDEDPDVWTYVTDGTYRNYHYGDVRISFTHTCGKHSHQMTEKTALLIQCIRACGKEGISAEKLTEMYRLYGNVERKGLEAETQNVSVWVQKALKKMIEENAIAV